MRFTQLMLHSYVIGDRLEAIGIIGHQHARSHTFSNREGPGFERVDSLSTQFIDRQHQSTDAIDRQAQRQPFPTTLHTSQIRSHGRCA